MVAPSVRGGSLFSYALVVDVGSLSTMMCCHEREREGRRKTSPDWFACIVF